MPRSRALLIATAALVLGSSSAAKAGTKDEPEKNNQNNSKRRILSFGGNGMIGSEVLHQLLHDTNQEEYDIVLVSRGSWPFDSEERIAPNVQRKLVCDRKGGISNCPELMTEVQSAEEY